MGGELLEAAEEDVRGGVRAGGGGAEPADDGAEEGIEDASAGEGEAEGGVEPAETGEIAKTDEGRDGDGGEAGCYCGVPEFVRHFAGFEAHEQACNESGDEDSGARGGEPVEGEDGGFGCGGGDRGGDAHDHMVEAGDGYQEGGDGVDAGGEGPGAPEGDACREDEPR